MKYRLYLQPEKAVHYFAILVDYLFLNYKLHMLIHFQNKRQ